MGFGSNQRDVIGYSKPKNQYIGEMDSLFQKYRDFTPRDFARRPRAFNEIRNYKATEFRQFGLYSGIVLLKDFLPEDQYDHFLLIAISYRLLSCPYFKDHLFGCDDRLGLFVQKYEGFMVN